MADLEHLIDTSMLRVFGEQTVVPLGRSIAALTDTVGGIGGRVQTLEQGGGGGGTSADVAARIDGAEQNILALTLAFAIEQGAAVNGTADNIVVEVFTDNTGFILISGMFDSTTHRIYA